ncbi:MAG TPA: PD-(D/E)XK nuclease family protein, partial [Edaphobacter sp.]|nr:PD-(D/E)XK nuclease family protein [Edaphobacter sp.]
ALWFLDAGDLSWPIRNNVNALLPWSLQRELRMPGANPEAEELLAKKITARLAASAQRVVFSFPKNKTEGTQRSSPLLRSLGLQKAELEHLAPADVEAEPVLLEEFSDELPIPQVPDLVALGGVEILKLQAACAFRAFAEKRLGSSEIRQLELGMDARELGSVLHRALEHFWEQVGSQENLKQMTKLDRDTTLRAAVDHALHRAESIAQSEWERAYLGLQRERLADLINQWLAVEMQRRPFSVKTSEEGVKNAQVGPLLLNLRVDRVDLTEEGEVIIDYKTGVAKTSQWEGDRPDEPQLPVYAIVTRALHPDNPPADIAFAQVRTGKDMALESVFEKVTDQKIIPRKRTELFEEQLNQWQGVLEQLANKFHSGYAEVDPKQYPKTCEHCAQRILCRLNPAAFDEDLDEETSGDLGNG